MSTKITRLFFLALITAFALPCTAQDLHNQGATIYISSGTIMHVGGDVVNHTGSTVQNNGNFSITGDVANQASLSGTGTLTLEGNALQSVNMGADSVYHLIINNPSHVQSANSFVIKNQLELQNGALILGSNNIIIDETASITNYSSSSYIITDSTGSLIQNGIGSSGRTGSIVFPVGSSITSYNPAAIDNTTGTKDNFSVNVYPTIYNSYSGGIGSGGALSSIKEVDRTWIITEATRGGSNVILNLQWNGSDEDGSFVRSNSAISYFSGGSWVSNPSLSAAGGANPYNLNRSGLSLFSSTPYGVGSAGSPLPVIFGNFDVVKQNLDGHITWSTTTAYHTNYFEVERSFDALHFETIATIPALNLSNTQQYIYDDKLVLQYLLKENLPMVYYRIKEVDDDGKTQSTGIKSLQENSHTLSSNVELVKLLPNPYTDNFSLIYQINSNMHIDFKLMDVTGKLIFNQGANVVKGLNQIDFKELGHLPQGVYMVQAILQNGEMQLYKVVKN